MNTAAATLNGKIGSASSAYGTARQSAMQAYNNKSAQVGGTYNARKTNAQAAHAYALAHADPAAAVTAAQGAWDTAIADTGTTLADGLTAADARFASAVAAGAGTFTAAANGADAKYATPHANAIAAYNQLMATVDPSDLAAIAAADATFWAALGDADAAYANAMSDANAAYDKVNTQSANIYNTAQVNARLEYDATTAAATGEATSQLAAAQADFTADLSDADAAYNTSVGLADGYYLGAASDAFATYSDALAASDNTLTAAVDAACGYFADATFTSPTPLPSGPFPAASAGTPGTVPPWQAPAATAAPASPSPSPPLPTSGTAPAQPQSTPPCINPEPTPVAGVSLVATSVPGLFLDFTPVPKQYICDRPNVAHFKPAIWLADPTVLQDVTISDTIVLDATGPTAHGSYTLTGTAAVTVNLTVSEGAFSVTASFVVEDLSYHESGNYTEDYSDQWVADDFTVTTFSDSTSRDYSLDIAGPYSFTVSASGSMSQGGVISGTVSTMSEVGDFSYVYHEEGTWTQTISTVSYSATGVVTATGSDTQQSSFENYDRGNTVLTHDESGDYTSSSSGGTITDAAYHESHTWNADYTHQETDGSAAGQGNWQITISEAEGTLRVSSSSQNSSTSMVQQQGIRTTTYSDTGTYSRNRSVTAGSSLTVDTTETSLGGTFQFSDQDTARDSIFSEVSSSHVVTQLDLTLSSTSPTGSSTMHDTSVHTTDATTHHGDRTPVAVTITQNNGDYVEVLSRSRIGTGFIVDDDLNTITLGHYSLQQPPADQFTIGESTITTTDTTSHSVQSTGQSGEGANVTRITADADDSSVSSSTAKTHTVGQSTSHADDSFDYVQPDRHVSVIQACSGGSSSPGTGGTGGPGDPGTGGTGGPGTCGSGTGGPGDPGTGGTGGAGDPGTGGAGAGGAGTGGSGVISLLRIDAVHNDKSNGLYHQGRSGNSATNFHDTSSSTIDSGSNVSLDSTTDTGHFTATSSASSHVTTEAIISHGTRTITDVPGFADTGTYYGDDTTTSIGVVFVLQRARSHKVGTATFDAQESSSSSPTETRQFSSQSSSTSHAQFNSFDSDIVTTTSEDASSSTYEGSSTAGDTIGHSSHAWSSNGYTLDSNRNRIDQQLNIEISTAISDEQFGNSELITTAPWSESISNLTVDSSHHASRHTVNEDETYQGQTTADATHHELDTLYETTTSEPFSPTQWSDVAARSLGWSQQFSVGTALTASRSQSTTTTTQPWSDGASGGTLSHIEHAHTFHDTSDSAVTIDDRSRQLTTYEYTGAGHSDEQGAFATTTDSGNSFSTQRLNGQYTDVGLHHGVGTIFAIDTGSHAGSHDFSESYSEWQTVTPTPSTTSSGSGSSHSTYDAETTSDSDGVFETYIGSGTRDSTHTTSTVVSGSSHATSSDSGTAIGHSRSSTIGNIMTISMSDSTTTGSPSSHSWGDGHTTVIDEGTHTQTDATHSRVENDAYVLKTHDTRTQAVTNFARTEPSHYTFDFVSGPATHPNTYTDAASDFAVGPVALHSRSLTSSGFFESDDTDWGEPTYHEWGDFEEIVAFEDDGDSGTSTREVHSDLLTLSPYSNRSHPTGRPNESFIDADAGLLFAVDRSRSSSPGTFFNEGSAHPDSTLHDWGSSSTVTQTRTGHNESGATFDQLTTSHRDSWSRDQGASSSDDAATHISYVSTAGDGTRSRNELLAQHGRWSTHAALRNNESHDRSTSHYYESGSGTLDGHSVWGTSAGTFVFVKHTEASADQVRGGLYDETVASARINDLTIGRTTTFFNGGFTNGSRERTDYEYGESGSLTSRAGLLGATGSYTMVQSGHHLERSIYTGWTGVADDAIEIGNLLQVSREQTVTDGPMHRDLDSMVSIDYTEDASYHGEELRYPYWTYVWAGRESWVKPVSPGGSDWFCEQQAAGPGCVPRREWIQYDLMPVPVWGELPDYELPAPPQVAFPSFDWPLDSMAEVAGSFHFEQGSSHSVLRDDSNRATVDRIDTRVGEMYLTNQHTTNRGGRLSDEEHNSARLLYDDSGTASIGSGPGAITVTYRLRERPDYQSTNVTFASYVTDDRSANLDGLPIERSRHTSAGSVHQYKTQYYDFVYDETRSGSLTVAPDLLTKGEHFHEAGSSIYFYGDGGRFRDQTVTARVDTLHASNEDRRILDAIRSETEARDYHGYYQNWGIDTRTVGSAGGTHTLWQQDSRDYTLKNTTTGHYTLASLHSCISSGGGEPSDDQPCPGQTIVELDASDSQLVGNFNLHEHRDHTHEVIDASNHSDPNPADGSFGSSTAILHATYESDYVSSAYISPRQLIVHGNLLELDHTHTIVTGGTFDLTEERHTTVDDISDVTWWQSSPANYLNYSQRDTLTEQFTATYENGGVYGVDFFRTDAYGPCVLCLTSAYARAAYRLDTTHDQNRHQFLGGWTADLFMGALRFTVLDDTRVWHDEWHNFGHYSVTTTQDQTRAVVHDEVHSLVAGHADLQWHETRFVPSCAGTLVYHDHLRRHVEPTGEMHSTWDETRTTTAAGTARDGTLIVHETSGSLHVDDAWGDFLGPMMSTSGGCPTSGTMHTYHHYWFGDQQHTYDWDGTFHQAAPGSSGSPAQLEITGTVTRTDVSSRYTQNCMDTGCVIWSSGPTTTTAIDPTTEWPQGIGPAGFHGGWGDYEWWGVYGWYDDRGGYPGIGIWSYDLARWLAESVFYLDIGTTPATWGFDRAGHGTPATGPMHTRPVIDPQRITTLPFNRLEGGTYGPGAHGEQDQSPMQPNMVDQFLDSPAPYSWWLDSRGPGWCPPDGTGVGGPPAGGGTGSPPAGGGSGSPPGGGSTNSYGSGGSGGSSTAPGAGGTATITIAGNHVFARGTRGIGLGGTMLGPSGSGISAAALDCVLAAAAGNAANIAGLLGGPFALSLCATASVLAGTESPSEQTGTRGRGNQLREIGGLLQQEAEQAKDAAPLPPEPPKPRDPRRDIRDVPDSNPRKPDPFSVSGPVGSAVGMDPWRSPLDYLRDLNKRWEAEGRAIEILAEPRRAAMRRMEEQDRLCGFIYDPNRLPTNLNWWLSEGMNDTIGCFAGFAGVPRLGVGMSQPEPVIVVPGVLLPKCEIPVSRLPAEPPTCIPAPTRPGTLTAAEQAEIQAIANKYNTTIDVVGSRAAGEGRNIGTDLPVGKDPPGARRTTRSDIDFRIDHTHPQVNELIEELGKVGNGAGRADVEHSTNSAGGVGRESYPPVIRVSPKN